MSGDGIAAIPCEHGYEGDERVHCACSACDLAQTRRLALEIYETNRVYGDTKSRLVCGLSRDVVALADRVEAAETELSMKDSHLRAVVAETMLLRESEEEWQRRGDSAYDRAVAAGARVSALEEVARRVLDTASSRQRMEHHDALDDLAAALSSPPPTEENTPTQ